MKWCSAINMWCSDVEVEELDNIGCDGECDGCNDCEDITSNTGVPLW